MKIAIIGGGPAGLIAADVLAASHQVDLYERGRTVGRKFLVAGDGGLNITNSVLGEELFLQFTPTEFMRPMLQAFGPTELRLWLTECGIATFVGSSGRVFPVKGITPAQVLTAIRDRLIKNGVKIHFNSTFVGFNADPKPLIKTTKGVEEIHADRYVFALGGASWPRTGSKGEWLGYFEKIGVRTNPFQSSNCGIEINWPAQIKSHAGKPLKNIAINAGGKWIRGEATITEYGLEGNAIYPLVPQIREQLNATGSAEIHIDLKPDNTEEQVVSKLKKIAQKNWPMVLSMNRTHFALLKTCTTKEQFQNGEYVAHIIKYCPHRVQGLRPIDEAISTVGGIALSEVSNELALSKHPHIFVTGEMVDVDAPTGGYLLQGAFSMGHWVGKCIADGVGN